MLHANFNIDPHFLLHLYNIGINITSDAQLRGLAEMLYSAYVQTR